MMAAAQQYEPPPTVATATGLLDLMMRLGELLANETALVAAGHVRDIEPLQREKLRLYGLYNKAVKELDASGTKITALPAPLRAQIVAASGTLAERIAENERTLRIGRAAARRLLDAVVETVQAQRQPLNRYNARLKPVRSASVAAVAIDRRM